MAKEGLTLCCLKRPLTLCSIGLAGDIHYDDDEIWTINGEQDTTDFTWTALHEIGHALGLRHSREENAIMWPWFTGYKPDTKLTQDDINGIQDIYGEANVIHIITYRIRKRIKNLEETKHIIYILSCFVQKMSIHGFVCIVFRQINQLQGYQFTIRILARMNN
jgi:hypothetical protein